MKATFKKFYYRGSFVNPNNTKKAYYKNIPLINFIVGRIIVIVIKTLLFVCLFVFLIVFGNFLKSGDLYTQWALVKEYSLVIFGFPSLLGFSYYSYEAVKYYFKMKESPFAYITPENLILDYGKTSYSWDSIQTINLKNNEKFIVTYINKKGRLRKRRIGLWWFQEKEDFISTVKRICIDNSILYHEDEIP